jgi:hypothetical protein
MCSQSVASIKASDIQQQCQRSQRLVSMASEVHRNISRTRSFASTACQHALSGTLNESAYLSVFPTRVAAAHNDLLLQLRRKLEDLIMRETDAAVHEWVDQYAISDVFQVLDRVTLSHLAAKDSGANDNNNILSSAIAGMNPKDRLTEARIRAKAAEVERLEHTVVEKETAVELLRTETQELVKCMVEAKRRIDDLSQQASSAMRVLNGDNTCS